MSRNSSFREERPEEDPHADQNSRPELRQFPLWQLVTSPWSRHTNGYQKHYEYLRRHSKDFEALDKEVRAHWESIKQPEWEYNLKVAFKNKLETILKAFLKRPLKIVITGSTVSGVGTANSDADMCMCAPRIIHPLKCDIDENGIDVLQLTKDETRRRIGVLLRRCKKALDAAHLGINIEVVDAQIPLLKMKGDIVDEATGNPFKMEVDLSVSNGIFISSLHNSHLIKGYASVDDRFAPLVSLVKKWSWASGVRDPQRRRFNSYTMTLLVIHFLQCGLHRPILPNLQGVYPEFFALSDSNHPDIVDLSADLPEPLPDLEVPPSGLNVAELFYLFIAYYATIDLTQLVIRIKSGRISKRERDNYPNQDDDEDHVYAPRQHQRSEVYIQDPIDEHNPGRTVDDWPLTRLGFTDALWVFNRIDDEDYELSKHFGFPDLEDLTFTA